MPINYRILGQNAPVGNTESGNYTVPTANSAVVKSINITNRSSNADTYRISFVPNYVQPINATFVATTNSTTSATSTDGITWVARSTPANFSTTGSPVAFGNSVFVGIGAGSAAYSSTDAITWTLRTLPSGGPGYRIAAGNNTFVAISWNSTTAASSTDAITWTVRTLPSASQWNALTFGNNTFVAISYNQTAIATSTDGITWTARTLASAFGANAAAFGNGIFVAVGDSTGSSAITSTDGISWTTITLPGSSSWPSITFGNGTFLAAASGSSAVAATSTNGLTWTQRTFPSSNNWYVSYGAPVGPFPSVQNQHDISFNTPISGNSTVSLKAQYTLQANTAIRVTSTNGTSTFTTFGAEIS